MPQYQAEPKYEFRLRVGEETLDATTAPLFDEIVRRQLGNGRASALLDLSPVRFADSVGLGFLVRLNRHFPNRIRLVGVAGSLGLCLSRVGAGLLPRILEVVAPAAGETVVDLRWPGLPNSTVRTGITTNEFAYVHPDA